MSLAVWQKALARLERNSWAVGRPPTARQWLDDFFSFYSSSFSSSSSSSFSSSRLSLPPPLPPHVLRLVAESFADAARLVRLEQLLIPSASSFVQKGPERKMPLPRDTTGVFVGAGGKIQSKETEKGEEEEGKEELERVLTMWCVSHAIPQSVEEVVHWLREVTAVINFFTLAHSAEPSVDSEDWKSAGRMFLTKSESMRVLHTALCAFMTAVPVSRENANFDRELCLLALLFLRKSGKLSTTPRMLSKTAKLIAARPTAQPWLLWIPTFAQACAEESRAVDASPLFALQQSSPLCQRASEIFDLALAQSQDVPNVEILFVEPPAARDERNVRAVSEELSRIASGA